MPRPAVRLARVAFARVAFAALALALAVAPVALAAGNDPRCADWLAHGAPPGVDLAAMCPDQGLMLGDLALSDEPLVPYIVGLLVMAAVLTVVGFVAMRLLAPSRRVARAADWWTCPTCRERNMPDRSTCFACGTPKGPPVVSPSVPGTDPTHPG